MAKHIFRVLEIDIFFQGAHSLAQCLDCRATVDGENALKGAKSLTISFKDGELATAIVESQDGSIEKFLVRFPDRSFESKAS